VRTKASFFRGTTSVHLYWCTRWKR